MSHTEALSELVKSEQIPAVSEANTGRFLRFSLGDETTGLLSLEQLVEVIKVHPHEILPIPKLPKYLLGIANRRGEAVWTIDLLYLMGASHLSERELIPKVCMAILIQAEEKVLGLLVEEVDSIEVYDLTHLQPFSPQTISSTLLPFLEGYFLDSAGNTLALLNTDGIIAKFANLE